MASKLAPTILPRRIVSRPRLYAQLDAGVGTPLTLVAAGPGFGKTVLLSDWIGGRSGSAAWLSLDPADNSSRRFWPLVGEALAAAGTIPDTDGFAAFPHDLDDAGPFLAALRDALPDLAGMPFVVDDAHLLTDPTVLSEIDAIVRYDLPNLRLVLSARSDPLLPLHRYRLAGQMSEIRAKDLVMTKPEARTLLRAYDVNLAGRDLATLNERTEGWPTALRLSAMRMAGSANPAQFVTQLALDQGSVGEYLIQEVLNQLPADARQLLIKTSFLDEVNGPLAAAVTGIADSAAILAARSRTNSFVMALNHDADRYRYHQLMTEILRYLLKREFGAEMPQLKRNAASWFEQQGDYTSALRYAVEADDWTYVSELLVGGGFAHAFVERHDVADLPLDGSREFAENVRHTDEAVADLHVAQAVVAVARGQLDLARRRLSDARTASLTEDAAATASLVELVAAHRAGSISALDRAAQDLFATDRAPDAVRSTPGLRAAIRIGQASARQWAGRPPGEVDTLLLDGLRDARRTGAELLEIECLGLLQLSHVCAGRLDHARTYEHQTQTLLKEAPHLQRMTLHHVAHGYAAFLRSDLTEATRALRRAEQTRIVDADTSLQAALVLLTAWTEIQAGRFGDAHHRISTAEELSVPLPEMLLRNRTLTLADLETRLGRPNAALKLTADPTAGPKHDPLHAVVGARAQLALGDLPAARNSLRPVLASVADHVPLPILVAALVTSARVSEQEGDDAQAIVELMRAVDLAAPEILQPFTDAREQLAGLLARHPEASAAWPLAAIDPSDGSSNPVSSVVVPRSLAEPLTERETAVVRRLATAMTTAEISAELCVSVNTVKTHIAAIYRKLPAAGRRDAVARARRLELL